MREGLPAGAPVLVPALVLAWALGTAPGVAAQSVVDRTPNVDGTWVAEAGRLHFHFLHRFRVLDPPSRKVVNSPTFLLSTGVPGVPLDLGVRYATSSLLVPAEPNELEIVAGWAPWAGRNERPLDVGVQVGYNANAESADGEVVLARDLGPVRLLGGARAFSAFAGGAAEAGWVAGTVWHLSRNVAVAADAAGVPGLDDAETAWGLGLQLGIPTTPHSLSLHLSNVNTTTLQGASVGAGDRRWGFEFTIPVTLSRYFGGGDGPDAEAAAPGQAAGGATVVEMDDRLRFLPDTVRILVGETVEWRNTSRLIHTVTADPGMALEAENVSLPSGAERFHSGEMEPGDRFSRRFTVAGTYRYVCLPHEAAEMVGVVVVEAAPQGRVGSQDGTRDEQEIFDDEGFPRVEVGDRVRVSGTLDRGLFGDRMLDARSVVTLNGSS